MKNKNVLIFDTAIGTGNLGDEIILESTLKGLKPVIYNSSLFRLGTHINNYSVLQCLKPNDKLRFFAERMDLKFVCGTSLVVPRFKFLHGQFMLNLANKYLYQDAVFVGVGKSKSYERVNSFAKYLYNNTFSKKYKHSVRDEATKKILESVGLKAINTGCPTTWGLDSEVCSKIPVYKSENVVFAVSGQEKYHNKLADSEMIKTLQKNYRKLYVWLQTRDDEAYYNQLSINNADCIEKIYSLNKYSDILVNCNVDYVGTRLHGGIYAMQHKCRSIIIAIDQRAAGIHDSNNIPVLVRDNIDKLDSMINSKLETDIYINREAIEDFLGQFV